MKSNDIFNVDKMMNEGADPRNFDSDEDYYAALKAPAKPRYHGKQSPGVNPDDEDYFREIWRKNRLAKQKAERDADHDRLATGTNEAEGDCEGLPHLTPELAKHISQQIDTEGPHAVEKSIEWGDGAAKELLAKIKEMLDDYASTMDESAAWQKKAGKNKNGGLNAKGVASYRREHPGSKLQTAVTTKPSKLKPGSKAAKRRKSFCARMGGMKGPMKDEHGKPTRKALALRKWNCESVEQYEMMIESYLEQAEMLQESLRTENPCWKGYKPVGTKKKNGKTVPNCVPKEGVAEGRIPDYATMFESTLNEFASCGGTGGIATSMSVGNPAAGSLFGGSYSQKNSPFKKTAKKRTGKMIKR